MSAQCPQSSLVEAMRDGRLGPNERASLERHLASCAECKELARDLELITKLVRAPIEPATPLEHLRARNALLGRASQLPSHRPPPMSRERVRAANFSRFALAAALFALAIGAGWLGGRVTSSLERPAVAFGFGLGSGLVGDEALARPSVRETTIRPSDDARFERAMNAGKDVVTLTTGSLDMTVRPLAPGERLVVRTTDAEIEVHASAFHVEAEQGRVRGVTVSEGSLEVRYAGFTAVIPSGGSWRATSEATPPPSGTAVATTSPPARVASMSAPPVTPREPKARPGATGHESTAPSPSATTAPTTAPSAGPSVASRDFSRAMEAIERGDYAAGASALEAFSAAHPHDTRADEAEYLQAIAFQRAGRNEEARAAAKRYLSARPDGAHRVEARRIAGD